MRRRQSAGWGGGSFFADLDQNVGFTSSGSFLPVLTRRASIFSFDHNRFLSMRELFVSQGHPPLETEDLGMATGCPSMFGLLKAPQLMELLGNSLHVATMGLWILYTLCNTVAVQDLDYHFDFVEEARLASAAAAASEPLTGAELSGSESAHSDCVILP